MVLGPVGGRAQPLCAGAICGTRVDVALTPISFSIIKKPRRGCEMYTFLMANCEFSHFFCWLAARKYCKFIQARVCFDVCARHQEPDVFGL